MNQLEAIHVLREWDNHGLYVFTKDQLQKLFFKDTKKAFNAGLTRLVKAKLLIRAFRGIYVNPYASYSFDGYTIEHIAKLLRPGEYNYVSLESILSEYGAISQIPIDRITVMTTGSKGICKTTYGVIEFTQTKRSIPNILDNIQTVDGRPLRIAYKHSAWRDLKRVGRNTSMVDLKELNSYE